jgi:hypothetical protein
LAASSSPFRLVVSVKKQKPWSTCRTRTNRTDGRPWGVAVASATAAGS